MKDLLGQVGTCRFEILVLDKQPPVIALKPSPVVFVLANDSSSVTVVAEDLVANLTDNFEEVAPQIAYPPPTGLVLGVGLHNVTVVAGLGLGVKGLV
jgi:hypothetical protein